jgi:DNA-binding response OmpR family regulator
MSADRSNPISIVVADGQPEVLRSIVGVLSLEGWQVQGVHDSRSLYLALLQRPVQVVVLAGRLRPEGGLAVVRQLRAIRNTASVGVILLAEPGSPLGLEALTSGADACVGYPPAADELKAYVRALERRVRTDHDTEQGQVWQYHQTEWKLVSPSGVDIQLSHLEAAFISIIARQAGKPVRRRDIISQAFGLDPLHYDNRRLEAIVSRLRKKVHRSYPLSQPIKVVHSIGYVFTDAVRCIELPGPGYNPK